MATTMVPLAEYLDTTYRPDRDWICGGVRERNVGEQPHATVQGFLNYFFRLHRERWGVRGFPEQRVQTSREHFRVADFCVVRRGVGFEPIVRTPPLLCVEVLSRDDRIGDVHAQVEDYRAMGVGAVSVIDPQRRRAYIAAGDGSLLLEMGTLVVDGTEIALEVQAIFAELDDLERNG